MSSPAAGDGRRDRAHHCDEDQTVELSKAPTDETATQMTARVIHDLAADVLCVVEAEDRPSLDRFNRDLLASQYGHAMLIDGNDPRPARETRSGYPGVHPRIQQNLTRLRASSGQCARGAKLALMPKVGCCAAACLCADQHFYSNSQSARWIQHGGSAACEIAESRVLLLVWLRL